MRSFKLGKVGHTLKEKGYSRTNTEYNNYSYKPNNDNRNIDYGNLKPEYRWVNCQAVIKIENPDGSHSTRSMVSTFQKSDIDAYNEINNDAESWIEYFNSHYDAEASITDYKYRYTTSNDDKSSGQLENQVKGRKRTTYESSYRPKLNPSQKLRHNASQRAYTNRIKGTKRFREKRTRDRADRVRRLGHR